MTVAIDQKTIELVARLSRIRLTPEEEKRLLEDFREILEAFSDIDRAKADVEPAFHPIRIENIVREDDPEISIDPDEVLEPMNTMERFIRGPRMQ